LKQLLLGQALELNLFKKNIFQRINTISNLLKKKMILNVKFDEFKDEPDFKFAFNKILMRSIIQFHEI